LEPIDLAGMGLLEWPIDYQEIADHLVEASRLCAIPDASRSWDSEGGFGVLGEMAAIRAVELRHGHRHAIRATAERLAESDQMWVLDATVTRLHVDDSSCVTGLDVVTSTGGRFRVEADATVLATGGIDNARILLDNPTVLGAMGAASSNVGRYFMEHLHFPAGYLLPTDANASRKIWDAFCDSGEERWITVSDEVVRSEGIARSAFVPIPVHPTSTSSGVQALGRIVRSVPYGPFAAQWWGSDIAEAWHDRSSVARAIAGRLRDRSEGASFVLGAMSEQRPNPESRVLLSDRTDRYGLRLADVAWRIDEADVQSALRSAEIVGSAFAEAGLARYLPGWTRRTMPAFEGGWHHLGTTRMSASAASGVVDSNARVHGLTNLYVAGSSVLPTGGFANPTLTLAALSLRLGYHLASRWRLST
jgi:choline dehydrogenase-like flavoprotein